MLNDKDKLKKIYEFLQEEQTKNEGSFVNKKELDSMCEELRTKLNEKMKIIDNKLEEWCKDAKQ